MPPNTGRSRPNRNNTPSPKVHSRPCTFHCGRWPNHRASLQVSHHPSNLTSLNLKSNLKTENFKLQEWFLPLSTALPHSKSPTEPQICNHRAPALSSPPFQINSTETLPQKLDPKNKDKPWKLPICNLQISQLSVAARIPFAFGGGNLGSRALWQSVSLLIINSRLNFTTDG